MSLKRYRVDLPNGGSTILQLEPEAQARDYPNATEVKVTVIETPETPSPRKRK